MAVRLIYARKNLQDKTDLRASNRYTCLGLMSRMSMKMHGLRSLTQSCLPDTVVQRASFPNTGHPCTFLAFPNSALKCLVLTFTSTVTPVIAFLRAGNTCIDCTSLRFKSASTMNPSHGAVHPSRLDGSNHAEKDTFLTINPSSTVMDVITMVESRVSRAARALALCNPSPHISNLY